MQVFFPINHVSRLMVVMFNVFLFLEHAVERLFFGSMIGPYGFDQAFVKLKCIPFYQLWIKGNRGRSIGHTAIRRRFSLNLCQNFRTSI